MTLSGPPIETNYEEEFKLVASRLSTTAHTRFAKLANNIYFRRVLVTLTYSLLKRRAFLSDPDQYLKIMKHRLNEDEKAFLMHHFSGYPDQDIGTGSLADRLAMNIINLMLRPQAREEKTDIQKLIARAWEDEDFMRSLLKDTKATIERTLGITLPKDVEFHVHEQGPKSFHLLLPTVPIELDEEI